MLQPQNNRLGWLFYDPEKQKISTTTHAQFNESSENRRCALRSFDLRQRKAGAGSDKDDEIQARLVRETYALDDFGELYDDRVSGAPSPSVTPAPTITERQLDHAATLPASNDLTSTPDSSVSRRRLPAQRSSRRVQSDEEEEEEEQENSDVKKRILVLNHIYDDEIIV